jgi:outer membrane lipoprotein-sorting protein
MLRRILTGIAALALFASVASAADPTVDELIAKNVKARGGMDKLKAVNSIRIHGRMVMAQGMEAPFTMMQKRPKMTRTEFTLQGMTGMQVYDGKNAWMVMPFMGKKDPEAMPAEQAQMLDEQADMDGPLVDYKEKGNKVELLGKEQVEGADAYKLKITLKNGQERIVYLDAESGLEVKTEAKRTVRGSEVEGESYLSDYKEVNGLMMPFTMENGAKGQSMRQKMVIDSVETNVSLADSLFLMPAGTKPATAMPGPKAEAKAGETGNGKTETAAATADSSAATTKATKASKKAKKP